MEVNKDPGMAGPLQYDGTPPFRTCAAFTIKKNARSFYPADRPDGLHAGIQEAQILHLAYSPLQEFAELPDVAELVKRPEAKPGTLLICMGEETRDIAIIPEPHHHIERVKHLKARLLTRIHEGMVGDQSIQ